jgi:hypothetical protein
VDDNVARQIEIAVDMKLEKLVEDRIRPLEKMVGVDVIHDKPLSWVIKVNSDSIDALKRELKKIRWLLWGLAVIGVAGLVMGTYFAYQLVLILRSLAGG